MLIKAFTSKVIKAITGIPSRSTMGVGSTDQNIIACVKCPKPFLFLEPLYDFLLDYVCGCPYIGRDNDNALPCSLILHNERP